MKIINSGPIVVDKQDHSLDVEGAIELYTAKVTGPGHKMIGLFYSYDAFDPSNEDEAEAARIAGWLQDCALGQVLWTEKPRSTMIEFEDPNDHEAFLAWCR